MAWKASWKIREGGENPHGVGNHWSKDLKKDASVPRPEAWVLFHFTSPA